MIIRKIDKSDAIVAKEIIRQAYLPLLMKYHDKKENPANKSIKDIEYDLLRKNSDSYILYIDKNAIGYVRVGQRSKGEYSIADLAILPSYQGNGFAQYFLKEVEKLYSGADK